MVGSYNFHVELGHQVCKASFAEERIVYILTRLYVHIYRTAKIVIYAYFFAFQSKRVANPEWVVRTSYIYLILNYSAKIMFIDLMYLITYGPLLYTNRQSYPFYVFHWWRAYHVRLEKLDCLPRISARGR